MFKCSRLLKTFLFAALFVLFLAVLPNYSQDIGVRVSFANVAKTTSKPRTSTRRSSSNRQRSSSNRSSVKRTVVVRTNEVVRNVKTSNLTVSSEPGANVVLLASTKGATPVSKKVPLDETDGTIEFENLEPGKYTVTVTLDGFETQEGEVEVPKQKTVGISMDLEPITYDLVIETNVKAGEIRYAPAKLEGKNPDGSLRTKESAGYCIVPIENGEAVISELKKGYYNIDVRPNEVEYQPILTAINVPTEIDDNTGKDEESSYEINLEKKISTETFSTSWATGDWNLPNGWSLQGKMMRNAGLTGVAFPRNEQYRYYTDFEMYSDVVSDDGKSVGFAVRAVDEKNYYLIQISGANSPEPFLASGFVVRDGVANSFFSVPIDHFAKTIAKEKSFRVIIKGEKNTFKIFIEDSETGQKLEVGNMIDRDEVFKKGAIGITGRSNANFRVGSFIVCAKSCS